jgi:hypothetical protein
MKALDDRMETLQRESVAAQLAERVTAIFERYPLLSGFSVQQRSTVAKDRAMAQLEGELCLADVSAATLPGFRLTQEFCNEIASALLEMMEEQPDASGLLSGRTFARTFQ